MSTTQPNSMKSNCCPNCQLVIIIQQCGQMRLFLVNVRSREFDWQIAKLYWSYTGKLQVVTRFYLCGSFFFLRSLNSPPARSLLTDWSCGPYMVQTGLTLRPPGKASGVINASANHGAFKADNLKIDYLRAGERTLNNHLSICTSLQK